MEERDIDILAKAYTEYENEVGISFDGFVTPKYKNCGLIAGDVIVSVNGVRTKSMNDYIEASLQDKNKKRTILAIRNKNELIEVTLDLSE